MHLVTLPKDNENMEEATIAAWMVSPGDTVAADTPIVSLITDKAEFQLPAGAAGKVLTLAFPARATVPVGSVLAAIGNPGETLPDLAVLNRETRAQIASRPTSVSHDTERTVRATPAARRLARQSGVDLALIIPAPESGGVIREDDVRAYMDTRKTSSHPVGPVVGMGSGVIGLGVDIVEVRRIRELLERHAERARDRLFTESERTYCEARAGAMLSYAGRFAVKEAVFKALGTGWGDGVGFRQVEVWNRTGGLPEVRLSGRALEKFLAMGGTRIWVSISHTDDYAVGLAVITK